MATATVNAPASADEASIRNLIESLHEAHRNKDAAGIAAPYTTDAAIYNLAPPLVHHGVNLEETRAWLDTWDGPIDLESRDLIITAHGDFAFCYGYVKMTGTKVAGQRVSFWMRSTLGLSKEANAWKIVHAHSSVPFYMDDTLRPAFDLEP